MKNINQKNKAIILFALVTARKGDETEYRKAHDGRTMTFVNKQAAFNFSLNMALYGAEKNLRVEEIVIRESDKAHFDIDTSAE